ncbi:penicillin-binding transpeptidase domain-containing protein [Pseudofulvimonas gallinarii]|uniref:penicillin-binding transpeptidase domain-containing protein n=1 Tax=Pseudofulvimonas gallinarii TaxID=634155 RepID=UPI0035E553AC
MELDNRELWSVFHRIGVGEVTGSGFPGEASGVLPDAQRWGLLHKVTMSYGYAISMTALQLAQAYGALANHGMLVPPTFVKGTRRTPREVFDPGLARTIVAMLETVTGPEGSGTRARVANYSVAGKTGTSRRATAGGYESRYVSVFAGMIPASSPRLVGIVVINDPAGRRLLRRPGGGAGVRARDGRRDAPARRRARPRGAAVDRLPPPEDSAESLPDLPAELLQFAEGVQP